MISIVVISKDEESLDDTLAEVTVQARALNEQSEIVVVDASEGRLDHIRQRHQAEIRWVQFERPPGVRVSIPHQRNAGVRAAHGEIIVFTDAGCWPDAEWLPRLVGPVREGENVSAGLALATEERGSLYDRKAQQALESRYLRECSTINLAFRRVVFDELGGFDERFAYGSDVDFSWRLVDAGYRIRSVPEAIVRHDWGTRRRQLRRSYAYGKARMRLYRKHRARLKRVPLSDPMMIAYPAFLLGLPLTVFFHFYPALLLIPAWRNRHDGAVRVLVDHLAYGVGILTELVTP
jgi:cellulose synthase/poly-beta-1,6-N-acetylglucosamine synthase-like glycosyltransferase